MDAIGASNELLTLFGILIGLPVLLLLFSSLVWGYRKKKRLAFSSYIITAVLTVFLIINNGKILFSYLPWSEGRQSTCLLGSIFTGLGVAAIISSALCYHKRQVWSNLLLNGSSLLIVLAWFFLRNAVNL